jgi:YidC/Oxa1 family membrane protein insertase
VLALNPLDVATRIAYELVMALTLAVEPLPGAAAIVLFTCFVRALLLPLTVRAIRSRQLGTQLAAQLATLPFFMVLYRLFSSSTVDHSPNELLGQTLWGAPLDGRFLAHPAAPAFWLVFVALAAVAWWTARQVPREGPGAVLRLLPYGTVPFAALLPLAAGIYLVASTAWTAAERAFLRPPPAEQQPDRS